MVTTLDGEASMNVEMILAQKGRAVHTIAPGAPLEEAIRQLRDKRVSALVVSEDAVHIAGILSDRDVVRVLAERGAAVLQESVGAVMTREVLTCGPPDTVAQLMHLMTEKRIRHIPVVDGEGTLIGLVSIGDVVKNRVDEIQMEADAMRHYIAGSR
jgi:CBS domain-containing protein